MKPEPKQDPIIETLMDDFRAEVIRSKAKQEAATFDLLRQEPHETDQLTAKMKKSKDSIRGYILGLRTKLERFSDGPGGISRQHRLSIPEETPYAIAVGLLPATTAFWVGHLRNGRHTNIVLAEPLGFRPTRPEHIAYTGRAGDWNLTVGWMTERPSEDGGVALGFSDGTLPEPSKTDLFRSVRLGDLPAMVSVYSFLDGWHKKGLGYLEPIVVGSQDVGPTDQDNLVILGTSDENLALKEREWDPRFTFELSKNMVIEVVNIAQGSRPDIESVTTMSIPENFIPVLVSRSASQGENRCVTLINGSHPLAVQEVCRLLTNEDGLWNAVVRPLGLESGWQGFPEDFQILFTIALSDNNRVDGIQARSFSTLERRRIEIKNVKRVHE